MMPLCNKIKKTMIKYGTRYKKCNIRNIRTRNVETTHYSSLNCRPPFDTNKSFLLIFCPDEREGFIAK